MTTWQNLSNQQKDIYREFHSPIENNIRQEPQDNDLLYARYYTPCEAQINCVCDTGDRLVRTINYRLTYNQRRAVRAWIQEHHLDHHDPILPLPENII